MNCSLNTFYTYLFLAAAFLGAALAASFLWFTAVPLFAAAAAVAIVSFWFIPAIKNAIIQYAACRGPPGKCTSPNTALDDLGTAAASISFLTFLVAGLLQSGALYLIQSWILSWLAPTVELAVQKLLIPARAGCILGIVALLAVWLDIFFFQSCMNQQEHP